MKLEQESDLTGRLMKNERRGAWLALVVVVVLATTLVLDSDTRRALLTGLAVALVFGVAWLGRAPIKHRIPEQESRQAVMQDEWRLAAIASAYKWAFVAMLTALSAICATSALVVIDMSAAMLAALAVALGVSLFLGLFLLFDRA